MRGGSINPPDWGMRVFLGLLQKYIQGTHTGNGLLAEFHKIMRGMDSETKPQLSLQGDYTFTDRELQDVLGFLELMNGSGGKPGVSGNVNQQDMSKCLPPLTHLTHTYYNIYYI